MLKPQLDFLTQFITNPTVVGAIAPSSPRLAKEMVSGIDFDKIEVIVEYGCGTGIFTGEILKQVKPGTTFFAMEINEKMVEHTRNLHPNATVYHDSVLNIGQYLEQHKVKKIDAIVSGLPWAAFASSLQDSLMAETMKFLAPQGSFTTFAYIHGLPLPPARRFKKKLYDTFSSVKTSSIVWLNLPPAFVYRCHK